MAHKFQVKASSTYAELWRYNIVVMGGGFDANGRRVDFAAEKSEIAPVGSNLSHEPETAKKRGRMTITLNDAESIAAYIYLIPHSLPINREIEATQPFDLKVEVLCDNESIYKRTHKINQWSGASIELKLPQRGEQEAK